MSIFSVRLKQLRLEKALTQKALSEITGLSERAIQSYELEHRKPTLDVIVALANALNVSTDYLLGVKNIHKSGDGFVADNSMTDFLNMDTKELKKRLKNEFPLKVRVLEFCHIFEINAYDLSKQDWEVLMKVLDRSPKFTRGGKLKKNALSCDNNN